jgi:hypothetical protein
VYSPNPKPHIFPRPAPFPHTLCVSRCFTGSHPIFKCPQHPLPSLALPIPAAAYFSLTSLLRLCLWVCHEVRGPSLVPSLCVSQLTLPIHPQKTLISSARSHAMLLLGFLLQPLGPSTQGLSQCAANSASFLSLPVFPQTPGVTQCPSPTAEGGNHGPVTSSMLSFCL